MGLEVIAGGIVHPRDLLKPYLTLELVALRLVGFPLMGKALLVPVINQIVRLERLVSGNEEFDVILAVHGIAIEFDTDIVIRPVLGHFHMRLARRHRGLCEFNHVVSLKERGGLSTAPIAQSGNMHMIS